MQESQKKTSRLPGSKDDAHPTIVTVLYKRRARPLHTTKPAACVSMRQLRTKGGDQTTPVGRPRHTVDNGSRITTSRRPSPPRTAAFVPHLRRAHEREGVRAAGTEGVRRGARGAPHRLSVARLGRPARRKVRFDRIEWIASKRTKCDIW